MAGVVAAWTLGVEEEEEKEEGKAGPAGDGEVTAPFPDTSVVAAEVGGTCDAGARAQAACSDAAVFFCDAATAAIAWL